MPHLMEMNGVFLLTLLSGAADGFGPETPHSVPCSARTGPCLVSVADYPPKGILSPCYYRGVPRSVGEAWEVGTGEALREPR